MYVYILNVVKKNPMYLFKMLLLHIPFPLLLSHLYNLCPLLK